MNAVLTTLLKTGAADLGVELDRQQLDRFALLSVELRKWNRKINLTAIDSEHEIVVKHFVDSLAAAKVVRGTGMLLDMGSGGGFPALPLKILYPELGVVSVDAVEKKIIFQRHAARLLGLSDFTALHARVETLADASAGRFDWITSRAFAELATFASLAAPLLKPDGRMVALKGPEGEAEARAAAESLSSLGIRVQEIVTFSLPSSGDRRSLVVMAPD